MALVLLWLLIVEFISNNVHANEPFFRKDYTYLEELDSFYKFSRTRANWRMAKKRCAAEGSELWIPENEAEVNAVYAFWEKIPMKIETIGFLGISDILSEGNFITIDGRSIDEVYTHWAPNEPNNDNNEDCVEMYADKTINDGQCGYLKPFMCKKRHATLDWNVLCDIPDLGYKYSNEMGKCYKVHDKPTNWDEAFATCDAEQSYLTIINSVKEKDVIVTLIKDAVNGNKNISPFIHMGFHNQYGDGWANIKGASLAASGYAVWADHKPEQGADHNCGAIQQSGELRGVGCDKEASFICEHDIDRLSLSVDEKQG